MHYVVGLKCTMCGRAFEQGQVAYVCPDHGDDGTLDVVYDYDAIGWGWSRESLASCATPSIWRYLPLLPVRPESPRPPLQVGWTPLHRADRLATLLGMKHLWIKDDTRLPTGSFKDRASAIAVVRAKEAGAKVITTASTGNAAAALAGLAASVNLPAVIMVPKAAPPAKIAQHLIYGARVLLVDGTYDDAFELTLRVADRFGWYNRNTGFNPYMTEGKKTAALEICEQLAWEAPDAIFVPVGDGCIIGGIHKGLNDLRALRWIEHLPRLFGVQADGSSSLVSAWERGLDGWDMTPGPANTVADSISAGLPRDRIKALRAVRETNGAFVRVSDQEILDAIPTLARYEGIFVEPAAAASYAGLKTAVRRGLLKPDARTVILATGSGLKDVSAAMKTVPSPPVIPPSLEAVEALLTE